MGNPYNTRTREPIVYSRRENRQRATEAKEHRESSQRPQRPFESSRHLTFTAMALPKQAEASQTARKTRVQTRSRGQAEEGEQQPSEIVNVDEIPSPETIPVQSMPILEEIQQPTAEAMNVDMPASGAGATEPGSRNPEGGATREYRSSSES
jgi:hypothetical protein